MKITPLFLLLSIGLTACTVLQPIKDQTVHHLLEPLVAERSLISNTPAIALSRPSIPSYLDRSEIVTRSAGQLMLSPIHLWAEPLDAAISRVTASNLSRLTGSMNIQPVEGFTTLDYTNLLEIRLSRFDPDEANQMILEGTWKLQPTSGKVSKSHAIRIAVPFPPSPSPMSARVTAMNQALERLARTIARQL